jgi:hypothetical protein
MTTKRPTRPLSTAPANARKHLEREYPALYARLPIVAAVIVFCSLVGLSRFFLKSDVYAWQLFQVQKAVPLYLDTITVTRSIDCVLAGQDPYTAWSFDPLHRLYNYPPIWLDMRYLGITSRSTGALALTFALMTLAALWALLKSTNLQTALLIFFAVASGGVLFAIERGNTDQVVFALLVFGLLHAMRKQAGTRTILVALLIVVLTVLKIYPVVAAAVLVRNRKGVLLAVATGVTAIAALLLTGGRDAQRALMNTPADLRMSFGAYPSFWHLAHPVYGTFGRLPMLNDPGRGYSLAAVALAVAAIAFAGHYRRALYAMVPPLRFDRPTGAVAASCLAVYCSVFISGTNYNYRLLFLIGVLAYLIEDLNRFALRGRSLALAVAIVLLLNTDSKILQVPHALFDLFVFAMAAAWLGTALLENVGLLAPYEASPIDPPLAKTSFAQATG